MFGDLNFKKTEMYIIILLQIPTSNIGVQKRYGTGI